MDEKNKKLADETQNTNEGSENTSLNINDDTSDVQTENVLSEEQEIELAPPEDENEASQINVGNILLAIFGGIAIILLIVVIGGSLKQKKQKEQNKTGNVRTKSSFNFNSVETQKDDIPKPTIADDKIDEDVKPDEEILKEVPPDFKMQTEPSKAPVAPVGSTGSSSSRSSRPDTRNSKSPRKIEGIKNSTYNTPEQNKNIISNVLSNVSPSLSRDEFIQDKLRKTMQFVNQNNSVQNLQANRESFFQNNSQNAQNGNGSYLSYGSLWDGTIISGALQTAINTDNPGVVIARVTENVYSSYDHSMLLIPEGSMLYATYNSSISYGQKKVQVAWNLLIRPDGYRVQLGNMNGISPQGESGYKGKVSNHLWEQLKALGMIAIYSLIETEIQGEIKTQNNEYLKNAMTDVYAQSAQMGNKIIDRALDIKPTITIKQGTEIKLITNIPLELPPVKVYQATEKYVRQK